MSAGVELEENHKTKKGEKADRVAWFSHLCAADCNEMHFKNVRSVLFGCLKGEKQQAFHNVKKGIRGKSTVKSSKYREFDGF